MKNYKTIFSSFLLVSAIFGLSQLTAFAQNKKGSLSQIKGKTLVYIADKEVSPTITDFIRSNSNLVVVTDRTAADFWLSLSTGNHGGRYVHPTQRNTPQASILNQIEGPMVPQPSDPQTTFSSQITYLTAVVVDGSGEGVTVWQKSSVTPVAPSSYRPNLSDSPYFRLEGPSVPDKVKISLLKSFLKDLSKMK